MRSSPARKWLIVVLLLAVTLGWKVVARSTVSGPTTDRDVQAAVAGFLVRQHFNVSVANSAEEGKISVDATAGSCRMLIARSPAMGWDSDMIRRNATADDHVFVVFRGRVYSEQPTWLTVFDALWARLWRQLGFGVQAHPVLAVVARRSCDAERLPWSRLTEGQD